MSRRGHRQRRDVKAVRQLPWQAVRNPFSPIEILSADQVESIVDAALTILETTGFRFLQEESRGYLQAAGADTSGQDRHGQV